VNVYVNGNVNGGNARSYTFTAQRHTFTYTKMRIGHRVRVRERERERGRTGGEGHTFLVKKMRKTGGADGPVRGKGRQPVQPSALRVGEKQACVRPGGGLAETAAETRRDPAFSGEKDTQGWGRGRPVRGKGWQPARPSALRVGEKRAGVRPGGGLGETALPVGTPAVPQSCAVRSRESRISAMNRLPEPARFRCCGSGGVAI